MGIVSPQGSRSAGGAAAAAAADGEKRSVTCTRCQLVTCTRWPEAPWPVVTCSRCSPRSSRLVTCYRRTELPPVMRPQDTGAERTPDYRVRPGLCR